MGGWYDTVEVWKIHNGKAKVITFVQKFGLKMTIVVLLFICVILVHSNTTLIYDQRLAERDGGSIQ